METAPHVISYRHPNLHYVRQVRNRTLVLHRHQAYSWVSRYSYIIWLLLCGINDMKVLKSKASQTNFLIFLSFFHTVFWGNKCTWEGQGRNDGILWVEASNAGLNYLELKAIALILLNYRYCIALFSSLIKVLSSGHGTSLVWCFKHFPAPWVKFLQDSPRWLLFQLLYSINFWAWRLINFSFYRINHKQRICKVNLVLLFCVLIMHS